MYKKISWNRRRMKKITTNLDTFKVFVTSLLLFWSAFIWHIFLEKKNLAGFLLISKWLMKICIFRDTQFFLSNYNVQFFHQPLCFYKEPAEVFSSPKKLSNASSLMSGSSHIWRVLIGIEYISKLLSNFGGLFTFCYLDGAKSIKTDLLRRTIGSLQTPKKTSSCIFIQ